LEAIKKRR
jgi:hypothetical protein